MAGDIFTASESKFFISSAAVTSVTDTVTEYEALTWVEVGTIESISEFGDKASDVTFASLADAHMRHARCPRCRHHNANLRTDLTIRTSGDDRRGTNEYNYGFSRASGCGSCCRTASFIIVAGHRRPPEHRSG